MTNAQALAQITASMPPGIARRVIRDALLGFGAEDAAEWHRMVGAEKKRRQRAASVPMAPSVPSGQKQTVPPAQGELTGQAKLPPSPAPSPAPPTPPASTHAIPPTPQGAEGREGEAEIAEKRNIAISPVAEPNAEPGWPDELRSRLAAAFRLTVREISGLERGDERMHAIFRLSRTLDRPTLSLLERLWRKTNGEVVNGQRVWRSTTLSAFLADPDKDISRARQLFPSAAPTEALRAAKPRIAEPEPPPMSEAQFDAAHEGRYRAKVRDGLVGGVPRHRADDPTLDIPPRRVLAAA